MELFEEVNTLCYAWSLYYQLNNIETNGEWITNTRVVDGISITKQLACGYGLNLREEENLLRACRTKRIFTKEIELAHLSGDREMYMYKSKGENVPMVIHQLQVVGRYVYITENIVCSPVKLSDDATYSNSLFVNLKEYVINHHTIAGGYEMKFADGVFTIAYNEVEHLRMESQNNSRFGIELTYPFVLYVLEKLSTRSSDADYGYENGYKIGLIRLKEGK